jgi:hypothetical protein
MFVTVGHNMLDRHRYSPLKKGKPPMQYAQPFSSHQESSTLTSETVSHNRRFEFTEVKLLLALSFLAVLSLVMLLILGWLIEDQAQAILNLLFILGFAG